MIVVSQDGKKMCTYFQFELVPMNEHNVYVPDWEIEEFGKENVVAYYAIIHNNVDIIYAKYDTEDEAKDHWNNLIQACRNHASYFRFRDRSIDELIYISN